MSNPKIERIDNEIKRTKAKIAELRSKLRTLERQKTDIEDDEVLSLVRDEKVSDAELTAFILSIRRGDKEKTPANKEQNNERMEESHNASKEEN